MSRSSCSIFAAVAAADFRAASHAATIFRCTGSGGQRGFSISRRIPPESISAHRPPTPVDSRIDCLHGLIRDALE